MYVFGCCTRVGELRFSCLDWGCKSCRVTSWKGINHLLRISCVLGELLCVLFDSLVNIGIKYVAKMISSKRSGSLIGVTRVQQNRWWERFRSPLWVHDVSSFLGAFLHLPQDYRMNMEQDELGCFHTHPTYEHVITCFLLVHLYPRELQARRCSSMSWIMILEMLGDAVSWY